MPLKPRTVLVAFHIFIFLLVIIPFLIWGEEFDALSLELISGARATELFIGTAVLLAVDIFVPVPSSAVSVSAGMLLGAPAAFMACFVGLTLGCFIGYGFGYYFRRFHFNRWHDDDEFREMSLQLSKYGYIVLLGCRGIPILAEMSLMVAGFHRYNFANFLAITALGNAILAGIYTMLGDTVQNVTSIYLLVAAFLLIPFVTFSVAVWWRGRVKAQQN